MSKVSKIHRTGSGVEQYFLVGVTCEELGLIAIWRWNNVQLKGGNMMVQVLGERRQPP